MYFDILFVILIVVVEAYFKIAKIRIFGSILVILVS